MNNKLKQKKIEKGFTLIEILVYIGIVSIIIFTVSLFSFSLIDLKNSSGSTSEANYQGVKTIQLINEKIKNSDLIQEPLKGGSSNRLVLKIENNDYVFEIKNNSIYVLENGNEIKLTSDDIIASSFYFNNLGTVNSLDSIKYGFDLAFNDSSSFVYNRKFEATVSSRNLNKNN